MKWRYMKDELPEPCEACVFNIKYSGFDIGIYYPKHNRFGLTLTGEEYDGDRVLKWFYIKDVPDDEAKQ